MLGATSFVGLLSLIFITFKILESVTQFFRYERMRKSLDCPPLRKYPGWDLIYGLDFVYANLKALKAHRFLEFQKLNYTTKVWTANFFGNRMVYSSEGENMKALSTTERDCFAIEPIRVSNGAITPFTGRGVSTSDGEKWQQSRNLVKPYFERAAFTNLDRLGAHTDRLISKIPTDGSKVDMQPLCQRWVSEFVK
jgi:cytochrome P450